MYEMTEEQWKNNVLSILKINGFDYWEEIEGTHLDGSPVRIDSVIQPPFNKNLFFGVEFKATEMGNTNYYTKHIKQAVDYSYSYFGKSKKRLFILLSPNPFNNDLLKGKEDYGIIWHLLTQFNIGFIDNTRYGLTIVLGGHLFGRIWSEKEGVKQAGIKRNYNIKTGAQ